jgi:hypothetical protein
MLMQIVTLQTICFGKFLNGIFVTVCHIAGVKMINETVPVYLMGKYGAFTAMSAQIGYFIVFGFGFGLPELDYNPEL